MYTHKRRRRPEVAAMAGRPIPGDVKKQMQKAPLQRNTYT